MIDKNEALRNAIDVMTAWTMQQDSTEFAQGRVAEYLAGPDGGVAFMLGLLSLAGWLLLRVAKAEGASGNATPDEMRAVLQDIARRTLQP
jgi:hypothetical protein